MRSGYGPRYAVLWVIGVMATYSLCGVVERKLTGGPLVQAAKRGDETLVAERIRLGDNCSGVDYRGKAALEYAALYGHSDVVRQLLDGCARASMTATEINNALIAAAYEGSLPVTRLLLDRGYGANERDRHGGTALMGAAEAGEVAVAQLLITAGADVNIRDSTGGAALHRAVEFGNPTMVELLLKHGADRRIRTQEGVSAWDIAVNSKNAKLLAPFRRDAEAAKGSLSIKHSQ